MKLLTFLEALKVVSVSSESDNQLNLDLQFKKYYSNADLLHFLKVQAGPPGLSPIAVPVLPVGHR